MALTHTTATRNAMVNTVVDRIDLGTTDANGDLVYWTSGDAEVCVAAFANPAFGDGSGGVGTANAIGDATSAGGGTIAKCMVRDRDNTEHLRGSVTATGGGGDIEITSVVIAATEVVRTTSLTYTAPP